MKAKFSFLMVLPFVLLGTKGNAQTQSESVIDENGKTHYTLKPQGVNNSLVFSQLNPNGLNLDWSGPQVNVSNTPTFSSSNARLAIGPDNSANLVYQENAPSGLQKMMFSKNTGAGWSEPLMVDTGAEISLRNNRKPGISAASNGDLHVMYYVWAFENSRNYVGYSHYTAATGTWSEGKKISDLGGTVGNFGFNQIFSTNDSLPVTIWDSDNRSGNDEIYLTYFDGTNWSSDIAVSLTGDGFKASDPKVSSLGNQKTIIIYTEFVSSGVYVNKYRIYDEITHALSAAQTVDLGGLLMTEYYPLLSQDGKVNIMFSYLSGGTQEVVKIAAYDRVTDTFSLKDGSKEIPDTGNNWQYGWDCNQNGECAIVLSTFQQNISVMTYSPDSGFGEPQTAATQITSFDQYPLAKFDSLGNLNFVWVDTRTGAFVQEIYHQKAMNLNLGTGDINKAKISVYPNPFHDVLRISDVQNVKSISVNDMTGRKVQNLVPSSELNLSNLKQGVYMVNLSMKDGSMQSFKVIKK